MTDQPEQLTPDQAHAAIADGKTVRCVVGEGRDDNPVLLHWLADGMVMSESIAGWSAGVVEPVCAIDSDFYVRWIGERGHQLTVTSQVPYSR